MYEAPWVGRIDFVDCSGRNWSLTHSSADANLRLFFGPDNKPVQINNSRDLPVLEVLLHNALGVPVDQRVGLLNVQIYDITWSGEKRPVSPRDDVYRTASNNVVPVIGRLRKLFGGEDNFLVITNGYKFGGPTVTAHFEAGGTHSPVPAVPASGRVVGREELIGRGLALWLADQQRPLFIWGHPGMGKTTLALRLLNDAATRERFGDRRYWLRCDGLTAIADVKQRMATEWFRLMPTSAGAATLEQRVMDALRTGPSACVIDGFDLVYEKNSVDAESWLRLLLGLDNVWLIVTRYGKQPPAGIDWRELMEVGPLTPEDSRELFCSITRTEAHRSDARLEILLV